MPPTVTRRALAALVLSAAVVTGPSTAHQTSVPLTFWADDFDSADARCQAAVGTGAAICGLRAWKIRRDCLLSQLDDGPCDEEADDAAIQAVRLAVFQGKIDPACRNADLDTLRFADLSDIQFDVVTFCRELEAAAVSVVFNPFFLADDTASLSPQQRTCIRTFASIATKAFNFTFRTRMTTLDYIANRRRSARLKTRNVAQADERVTQVSTQLELALHARCSQDDFQELYGFSTAEAVALVTSRSACLTGRTYPVLAFDCPEPVCGNGMREPLERCDDGNSDDGDGCSARCQLEF